MSGGEAAPATPVDPLAGLTFRNGWARIPFNAVVFGGYGADQMSAVIAGGPGVIAGGFSVRNGDMDAAIWVSDAGIHWQRIEAPTQLGGSGAQRISAITAGEGGFVAVGSETIGSDTNAAVWFSKDGLTWSRVASVGRIFGDAAHQSMSAVTALGTGFVAVGTEETDTEVRGAVWTSPNGTAWRRIPHSEEVFGGTTRFVSLEAIHPVGSSLLAVGMVEDLDVNDVDTALWFSHDGGNTWTPITTAESELGDPDAVRYQLISGIAQNSAGFIMTATEQNVSGSPSGEFVNGLIWWSPDGLHWERRFDHKPDYHSQYMLDVAATSAGFVVVGYEVVGDQASTAVWMSADGTTWTQVPPSELVFGGQGVQRMNAVAEAGLGVVAVGTTTETGDLDAAVWIYIP